MTADPMAVELARVRAQLRAAEDEIADLRKQLARRTVDVPLPEPLRGELPPVSLLVPQPSPGPSTETVRGGRRLSVPVMTPEQQAAFDARHADRPTPGCDCGHDGMGEAWHASDCEWRAGVDSDAANPLRHP